MGRKGVLKSNSIKDYFMGYDRGKSFTTNQDVQNYFMHNRNVREIIINYPEEPCIVDLTVKSWIPLNEKLIQDIKGIKPFNVVEVRIHNYTLLGKREFVIS